MAKLTSVLVAAVLLWGAGPAAAQQTLNLTLGAFVPGSEDARVRGDVLNENRRDLLFDVSDFTGVTIGGEWLVALGPVVEAGAGAGFYRRSVDTVYERLVDSDGSEIEQTLRLRVVPMDLTLRVAPLGPRASVQPYVGAGLGVLAWRYSEAGEFVSGSNTIFRDQYVASGTATALVVVAGVRFADPDFAVGGEVRYRRADVALGSQFAGADPRLDLGGWTYQLTIGRRF
jgi:hypothetical protein